MPNKLKKIDKEYKLTDSSVNCYGFRLLTSGYLMGEYQKNPVGYHMHGGREEGVLVRWEDLRQDGDSVFGKPVINLTHPRGERTVDEIENGFLNAASLGHFVVLELSSDPADILEGQSGPTVSKWFNRECSLVDIPGNYSALTPLKLYDKDLNEINLADFSNNKSPMKQILFTAANLAALNLKPDTADSASVDTAFNDLVAKAAKVDQLTQELASANTAKTTAETALDTFKKQTSDNEVNALLASGLAANKFSKVVSDNLKTAFAGNPIGLKATIDALPVYNSLTDTIEKNKGNVTGLAAKSWSELDKANQLEELKASDPETFKAKYKDQFKTDYTGK